MQTVIITVCVIVLVYCIYKHMQSKVADKLGHQTSVTKDINADVLLRLERYQKMVALLKLHGSVKMLRVVKDDPVQALEIMFMEMDEIREAALMEKPTPRVVAEPPKYDPTKTDIVVAEFKKQVEQVPLEKRPPIDFVI